MQKTTAYYNFQKINGRLTTYLFKTNQNMAQWLRCNMLMLNISVAKYIVKEFTSKQLNDLNELSQKLIEELKELPEREVKKEFVVVRRKLSLSF